MKRRERPRYLLTILTGWSAAPTELSRPIISLSTSFTSAMRKKNNGERASLIKSTIFVTSSVVGHAQADFGVFPFTAETRVPRRPFIIPRPDFPFFSRGSLGRFASSGLLGRWLSRRLLHGREDERNYIARRHETLSRRRGIVPWRIYPCDYSREPARLPTSIHPLPLVK